MKLGEHFNLEELTFSQTAKEKGISNAPGDREIEALSSLVQNVLDPLRKLLGKPVRVTSGFRSVKLNTRIGGAATSQHCLGQAADINVPGMTVSELVAFIRHHNLPFDQLIDEFGSWVHVSYSSRQRRQVLIARTVNGKTVYSGA